jgi:hypothetical protein
MYYRNFDKPPINGQFSGEWGALRGMPQGWAERTPEEVAGHIEKYVGENFSLETFEEEIKTLQAALVDLKNSIDTEFSILDIKGMRKEEEILKEIEKFNFKSHKDACIKASMPNSLWSRDTEALNQGMCLPAWLYYSGIAYDGRKTIDTFSEYRRLTERVIKQILAKVRSQDLPEPSDSNYAIHPEIKEKCYQLYEAKAYAEAVEKSFKVVKDRLRKLTGFESGSDAFGKGKLFINGAAAKKRRGRFQSSYKISYDGD